MPIDVFWQTGAPPDGAWIPPQDVAPYRGARMSDRGTEPLIRDRALALGFDAVGFCRAELGAGGARSAWPTSSPPASTATWAGSRDAATQRADPRALWPEARSVIALGLSYAPDDDPLATLAQHDRGNDLGLCPQSRLPRRREGHAEAPRAVHRRALRPGGESVRRYRAGDGKAAGRSAPGSAGRASTPTWSRARTARGCSSARSTPRSSSPPTRRTPTTAAPARAASMSARPTPFPRRTGSMRRAASPTSRSSIAGPIPHELRPLMGNRIYGCDDCLAVCPWNRFARATPHAKLRARAELTAPRLARARRPGRCRLSRACSAARRSSASAATASCATC